MTDEEIEKELKLCHDAFYWKSVSRNLLKNTLDYINRLKEEKYKTTEKILC